jgi:DNA-binding MarR family transcriptional regulator
MGELFAAQRRLRGRDAQKKDGLTHAQLHVLRTLADQGGELPASRLAACADITPTTVTQMVDPMVEHGLVERRRSEEDRRLVFVRLTPAGRELVDRKRAEYDRRWREQLAGAGSEELNHAAEVLRGVARVIDGL